MSTSDSSLYWACYGGDKQLVLKLANPNNVNYVCPYDGETPLHRACIRGWLDIIKLLIETYGCDSNVKDIYHASPLDYAERRGKSDVVTYLQRVSLYSACFQGRRYKHLVHKLMNLDSINYVHPDIGDTPLHQACKQGWLDVVKVLIEMYGCDSNVNNKYHQSPMDYAKQCGKVDVFSYLQRIHSSLYWACAQGIKHLVLKLANPDNVNCVHPDFGDTPLHQACRRGCLDIVVLLIKKYGCDPNVRDKGHESVLHYACRYGHIDIVHYLINKQHLNPLLRDNVHQSEPLDCALNNNQTDIAVYLCQHCISSDEMLNPNRIKTTINLIKYILRTNPRLSDFEWKSANGDNILVLVGSSKTCISHIPSAVVLEILNSRNARYIKVFKPDWKTSDGDNILELTCQSEIFLSRIHSALILKWLVSDATINQIKKSIPDSKTADGDSLIQLVCQSEICISHISTVVLTKWLSDTTLIQNLAKIITPDWKTADDYTLLQLVCKSETIVSQISSAVLTKWLSYSTTTLDLTEVIVKSYFRTEDGVTLFQLICQSEKFLIRISSTVFLKWLWRTPLESVIISLPDSKTADGDTLLQLVLYSVMSISQTSSVVLSKLLSDSREVSNDQIKKVNPNWKTLDGIPFLYALCQSTVEDIKIVELMQHYNVLKHDLNTANTFLDSEGNTALHIACQANKLAVVSYLINQAHCDPNIRNKTGSLPLDMTTNSEVIYYLCQHDNIAIYSKTIVNWINKCESVDDTTMLHILKSLVGNHRYKTDDGSTLLHVLCMHSIFHTTVDFLLTEGHCDPNCLDNNGQMPLQVTSNYIIMIKLFEHGAKMTADVVFKLVSKKDDIINKILTLSIRKQAMLWNPNDLNSDGYTALHLACKASNPTTVNFLLSEAHCDPNVKRYHESNGATPLHVTSNSKIMSKLIEHGAKMTADVVFKLTMSRKRDSIINKILILSIRKQVMLWNPNDLNSDGYTALHLACKGNNPTTVNVLLSEAHCDPNVRRSHKSNGATPLHVTSNSKIMTKLIEYGAKMTADVVFKLIMSRKGDSIINEILTLSIRKQVMLWNPNDLNSDGYTALHLACKANNPTTVNVLLSEAHCDPNIKRYHKSNGATPLYATSDSKIMTTLIEYGAKMTADVVFKLIMSKKGDSEILTLSIRKQAMLWNPNDLNSDGYTALHLACEGNNPTTVNVLLSEAHCDPNVKRYHKSNGATPLHVTSNSKIMTKLIEYGAKMTADVVFKLIMSRKEDSIINEILTLSIRKQVMLWNPNDLNSDGYTALHLACKANNPTTVNFLLSEAHCDPNVKRYNKSNGATPLYVTSDSKIMTKLVEYGAKMTADVVFKLIMSKKGDSIINEILTLSIRKQAMLWNPNDLNSNGYTALHLACEGNNPTTVNFLLSEAHCDPNVKRYHKSNGATPLYVTSDSKIMTKLIKYGAKMTADVVFKLIMSRKRHSIIKKILTLSIRKQAMLWNPNDLNSDGYTALHLACEGNNPTTVNFLLSEAHCDPNIKSNSGEVPLQVTVNPEIIKDLIRHGAKTSIMYESHQNPLGANKPIQPPVKVFIVGNPSVGKSTLTAALKKKLGIIARMFSGKVSGVDKKTVGIVPHDIESDIFGRVTLYDFAGHREFYSGHAALLQTAIQSTPPVFLLVINLCEDVDEIIKNILYWISFLENQCASVSCKPHIILVGSHADALKGINPKDKIDTIVDSLNTNCFTNMEYIGFVALNCQYHESTGMNDLRRLLIKSCGELRIQEPITFNAHCFLVFLINAFIDLTAVTIKDISEKIENQQSKEGVLEFLPTNIEALYKICLELNDRGHILLLKDRIAIENSYVVIDKEFLLSEISGTVFAPEGFRQYKELSSNTGVVPLSKIVKSFPDKDINVLIGYLTHLEFCHEISDQALLQRISKDYSQISNERYYLFPGLISLEAETNVWETESHFNHHFGWILQCTSLAQFFTSRFLQVLLLRLAFSLALESKCDDSEIGIHRKCSIWKNGIFWGREFGMETLIEVVEDKSVIVMARFQTSNLGKCIKHRSEVIYTVLECLERFCPRVSTTESFINASSPLRFPFALNSDKMLCTVQDLAQAIVGNCVNPSVVLSGSGKTMPAERFISFEPYTEIEMLVLQELWDKNIDNKIISDEFLSNFVRKSTLSKLKWFAKIFNDSADIPSNKDAVFQEFLKWTGSEMTYKHFRQKLDQYSVFAGRNVLELAGHKYEGLSVRKEETQIRSDQIPRVNVECERPQLHELQLLIFNNGRELRIIETVASKWKGVAIAMGFNKERIELIEKDEHCKQEEATCEMFGRWLKGEHDLKPATWGILIQCLKQANLPDIAKLLSNIQSGCKKETYMKSQEQVESPRNRMGVSTDTDTEVLQRDCGAVGSLPRLDKKALEVVEGRGGRKIRVIESIGSQWEEVAKALDMGQEDIDVIKTRHSDNDEEACHEMLATWLEGNDGEVSWTVFTQALIDAGLLELADTLKDALR